MDPGSCTLYVFVVVKRTLDSKGNPSSKERGQLYYKIAAEKLTANANDHFSLYISHCTKLLNEQLIEAILKPNHISILSKIFGKGD